MPGKFLIDVTDPRLFIPANDDVIAFVRRTNPFAHSDVGSLLLGLGKELHGAEAYCPSFRAMAYVVLHTSKNRIFAIAFDQRGLAFRLPRSVADAIADGGQEAHEIGRDWVRFEPWSGKTNAAETQERLRRWCARAFAEATSEAA